MPREDIAEVARKLTINGLPALCVHDRHGPGQRSGKPTVKVKAGIVSE